MFKILKKAVSGALAGLMLVSVLPVSVSADEATVYFSKDFKSAADIGNDDVKKWSTGGSYGYDKDLDAGVFKAKWSTGNTQQGLFLSPKSGTYSAASGKIMAEYRFRIDNDATKASYIPLAFDPSDSWAEGYMNRAIVPLFITGGKIYATKRTANITTTSANLSEAQILEALNEVCTVTANTWYTVKLYIDMDKDTTTFTNYHVYIKNETTNAEYRVKDMCLGVTYRAWPGADTKPYAATQFGSYVYGFVYGNLDPSTWTVKSMADVDTQYTLYMNDISVRQAQDGDEAIFDEPVPDPEPSDDKYFINEDFENGDPTTTGDKWSWNWNVKELKTENNNSYLRIMRATTDTSKQYAPSGWYYKTAYGKSGNVVVEGDFRINSTVSNEDKEGVFPIYLKTAEDLNKVIRTVYAKNDALYAVAKMPSSAADKSTGISNEVKLCDIDSTKWYNIKIVLNVDGKADTVDTFMCQVTDKATGNVLNTSGPYALGYKNGRWQAPEFDITQIGNIGFGMTHDFSEASISCDIDNIKVYEAEALTVTSSVENGAANVEPGAVALTFNYAIAADSVSQITLYEKKNGSWTSVSASKTLDSTGKIATITADTMKYGKEYKIVVPTTVSAVTGEALKAEVEITFTTKEMPKVLVVSNVKFNGSTSIAQLTPGACVKVTADFKNTGLNNNQPATLIVAAYNNDGTMVAVAYKRKPIALNTTESLDASITLPTAEGKQAAQIKVFAWDDFESMQEMSDVVIMPQ